MFRKGLEYRNAASAILLLGITQWILLVIIAEGVQPDYISSIHYISSL